MPKASLKKFQTYYICLLSAFRPEKITEIDAILIVFKFLWVSFFNTLYYRWRLIFWAQVCF